MPNVTDWTVGFGLVTVGERAEQLFSSLERPGRCVRSVDIAINRSTRNLPTPANHVNIPSGTSSSRP
jgi:hypothetical protein